MESPRADRWSPVLPDPSFPARPRGFDAEVRLAGNPANTVLALPDDRLLYLAALLRDTPVPALALSLDEWREFRGLLVPHGVFPLLAYRLRAWPEDCRPPAGVMAYLNRVFLYAAARTMRAGRQIQAVVDALEAAGIPSVLLKGPALARTVYPSMSGSSTDSGATMAAATNRECPPDRFRQTGKIRRSPPVRVGGLL